MQHLGSLILQTPRLTLRRFVLADAQAMFENWANDPEVTKYMTWFAHSDAEETKRIIAQWVENYSNANFYQWAIVLKQTHEPIGSIGVVRLDEDAQCGEIGYCIGRAYWHRGYTSEALEAVIRFLFGQVGMQSLTARHDVRNPNSGGVMKKCGMKHQKTEENIGKTKEGEVLTCAYYAICNTNNATERTCLDGVNENV